ncbi:MAG: histidine kinase [Bacteroidetes bacterium]|nr:histidine kinase [Bacteroidota bacterium]
MKRQVDIPLKIFLNILVWASIILFPYLFSESDHHRPPLSDNLFELSLVIIFFYLNFFFLIKRYLFGHKYITFITINIVAILLFLVIRLYYDDFHIFNLPKPEVEKFRPEDGHEFFIKKKPPINFQITQIIFPFLMSLGAAVAIRSTVKSNVEEDQRKKLENEHLKSEITYLKYQIQPHFFFNTLNNIYSLIDLNPENAKESLHRLSKLMRFILYHANNQEVLLKEELIFIENYVELMKIRTQDNVAISLEIPHYIPSINLPPLLYITLVENAFKHGIDPVKKSIINIWFLVTDNQLHFEITNTNYPKMYEDKSGSGIGIVNLKKRIELIFAEQDYVFEQKLIAEFFVTKLIIPIKNGKT